MRLLIAGAGALGTCYAALLARAGAGVTVLAKPERAGQLAAGLRVSGLLDAEARVPVVTSGAGVGRVDYLLLTTKAADTPAALRTLEGAEPDTVFSLQNGLEKNAPLVERYGAERVVGAACVVGAGLLAPGHARLTLNAATWLGELGGGASQRVVRLVAVLRAAGFPSWSVPDVTSVEWYKQCALLPGALVTALSRRTYDEMALHPDLSALFVTILRETFAVARAQGVTIADPPGSLWPLQAWLASPDEAALAGLRAIGERQRAAGETPRPSLLQDVLAQRRTEAEEVVGGMVRRARALGVPVPATEACYRLVRGLEDGFPARV